MKIYLAGFDVFRPDAVAYGESLKQACEDHGFTGLYPLDNTLERGVHGRAAAEMICHANLELIRQADCVMGNLNPFRGHEPDSGTAFELGFATALGKDTWGYTSQHADLVQQIALADGAAGIAMPDERYYDSEGFLVENFGLNVNLMLACTAHIVVGSALDCLAAMALRYRASGTVP
nr:nucleoside 2-deoxyribosyltransferase [Pseudomonas sp.]